jgi:hypothetical protein
MLIGGLTVFLVAHQPISPGIGAVTIVLLLAGYGVGFVACLGRAGVYLETILLSLTAFFDGPDRLGDIASSPRWPPHRH